MAITAIGAAFFAGVTASSGDMKRSSDNYYDEYNMNDLRIISSIGLTDDDLQVIAKVQGVKAVYGANSKDVLINYDDKESVAHVLMRMIMMTAILTDFALKREDCHRMIKNVL